MSGPIASSHVQCDDSKYDSSKYQRLCKASPLDRNTGRSGFGLDWFLGRFGRLGRLGSCDIQIVICFHWFNSPSKTLVKASAFRCCETRRRGTRLNSLELRVDTFFLLLSHFQLATLDNLYCLLRLIPGALFDVLDFVDDFVISFENFTKNDMSAVQPGGDGSGNEELYRINHAGRLVLHEKVISPGIHWYLFRSWPC